MSRLPRWTVLAAALALAACASGGPTVVAGPVLAPAPAIEPLPPVVLLGEVDLFAPFPFEGVEVGGLSGLTALGDSRYLAVSDDSGASGPPRALELRVELAGGPLQARHVEPLAWHWLRVPTGEPLRPADADFEGIARAADGELWLVSEGSVADGHPPFLARFAADGLEIERIALPPELTPGPERGARHNLGFESLTLDPDGRTLYLAVENALAQDGPVADRGTGSPARIWAYDVDDRRWAGSWVYPVEPVASTPLPGAFRVSGLVELLALGGGELIAMERSFAVGGGMDVTLFRVDLAGADDVSALDALAGHTVRPVAKRRWFSPNDFPTRDENLEAMALGPRLPDGRRTLILLGDNNFEPSQATQLLAFAW